MTASPTAGTWTSLGGRRAKQSFAQRLATTCKLVGYAREDAVRVQATRDVLSPWADAIARAVYEHLLAHPETAVQFIDADGRPDRGHLAERSASLKGWLRTAIEAPLDEHTASYLADIGRAHTKRGSRDGVRVQGRYLVAMMSFLQTALLAPLDAAIADRAEMVATIAAWNKLLMIHLDLFLAVYGGAEGNPHWY